MAAFDSGLSGQSSAAESQLRVQLERAVLDRRKLAGLRAKVDEAAGQLETARIATSRANQKAKELEDTALKLTEWNGQLEARLREQEAELQAKAGESGSLARELEGQLVGVTAKRIAMVEDYARLELQLAQAQLSALEHGEVADKLRQENAILKSRLGGVLRRGSSSPGAGSKAGPALLRRVPLAPDADPRPGPSITDIFRATFPN